MQGTTHEVDIEFARAAIHTPVPDNNRPNCHSCVLLPKMFKDTNIRVYRGGTRLRKVMMRAQNLSVPKVIAYLVMRTFL